MALDEIQKAAQEQFDRQSARYGRSHILADVSDVDAALQHVRLPAKARVLDVATGGGHTGVHLASLGCEVTVADISAAMLSAAAKLATERGLHVETREHSAEELPYADGEFDVVTCRVAPHHFSSPQSFVAESARVLRSGGWFVVIDGSVPDDQPEAEEWLHHVEKLRDPSHHRLLTPGTWRKLCAESGLDVPHCELTPFKQPDLEWYFETANTSPENRAAVRALVHHAPASARRIYGIGEEDGKITWWWPRLTLVAQKVPVVP